MNTQDTRSRFIDYFRERGHERILSSSLIPPRPDDPVLFVTSGMHPLIPHLRGEPHPQGTRLVNSQRCLRTTDLDQVGDSTHLTVFEMLGSWSLGDYPHEQSLRWGWQLLTEGFDVEPRLVCVTVFGGDERCGPDLRSEQVWSRLGLPPERIVPLGSENWWTGPDGTCGPDSEMFVWTGDGDPEGSPSTDGRWVEVWNHVSMRYRESDGGLVELPHRCVDTGMGLERTLMVLQGVGSVYDTDLFVSWTRELDRLWRTDTRRRRLLSDHLRSITVMCSDGVRPSNSGRGYVLRRLIRRTLTEMWGHGGDSTLGDLPDGLFGSTLELMGLRGGIPVVRDILLSEERRFRSLIERGRPLVERELRRGPLGEPELRYLHDTHGLPRDLLLSLGEGCTTADRRLRRQQCSGKSSSPAQVTHLAAAERDDPLRPRPMDERATPLATQQARAGARPTALPRIDHPALAGATIAFVSSGANSGRSQRRRLARPPLAPTREAFECRRRGATPEIGRAQAEPSPRFALI